MKTPNLFNVPKVGPTRKERITALKKEHGIWTHRAPFEETEWSALKLDWALQEFGDSSNDPHDVIANYCRLLDDAGWLVVGKTEIEAIRILCTTNKIFCPL